MKTPTKAVVGVGAGLVVMAGIVVAVQLLDGGSGVSRAAEVLPADTTRFTYVDRDAWAERVGIHDIGHDFSDDDLEAFRDASENSLVVTPLAQFVGIMQDAAFNEFDVDWYVRGGTGTAEDPAPSWDVYRMDRDLDLDDVADALEDAGWSREEIDGNPRLTLDLDDTDNYGLAGDYPAMVLRDVTIVEDEHLMIVSSDPDPVLDVVAGDADSLADESAFNATVDQVDDVELAIVRLGENTCLGLSGSRMTPEEVAQAFESGGAGDLGSPDATGYFQEADGDDAVSVGVLVFSSDAAAEADALARETWLEDGLDPFSHLPMADYVELDSVDADGEVVTARGSFETERIGSSMVFKGGGLTFCPPAD